MGRGVSFPEQNLTLVGTPEERAAGTVYDLHAFRFRDLDGLHNVITCWELDDAEIEEVIRTRRVWTRVVAPTQPPMCVQGNNPFKD